MVKDFLDITYEMEDRYLSEFSVKSQCTQGRQKPIESDGLRTEFQRDRDRILHSKAFRRLKHKTQVFLSPEGDHYRTRLTHTIEVSQIARTIARSLRLNEDLAEAIALGHDLGHTPYGHAGERALDEFVRFNHAEQSLKIVDFIENEGEGLNLTFEVRDGILNHTSKGNPATLEGHVVTWADRIAYINHDIDDAIRGGVLKLEDIPSDYIQTFGTTHSKRINSMILDIIYNSFGKKYVKPSEKYVQSIAGLRQFMFDNVYRSGRARVEEKKAIGMISFLYKYYLSHSNQIPPFILAQDIALEKKVCDYIAMMSDRFANAKFVELSIPRNWQKL